MHPVYQFQSERRRSRPAAQQPAFTLVELMVVVGIIGLLIAILVPGIGAVQSRAKATATKALFSSLDTGITQYQAEEGLGGVIPPSASDNPSQGMDFSKIDFSLQNPGGLAPWNGFTDEIAPICGANLLVYALAGLDLSGTAGFKDVPDSTESSTSPNVGRWWDDVGESYALDDTTFEPVKPRFNVFVSQSALDQVNTIKKLADIGSIVEPVDGFEFDLELTEQPFFTDAWDRPVLYYRARSSARSMISDPSAVNPTVGFYDQRDNQVFTGSDVGSFVVGVGLDFGAGTEHKIKTVNGGGLPPTIAPDNDIEIGTFASFIHDENVTSKDVPVNRETYLLISAGQDALYGTADDITNWSRD